jgi:hypothetical protein
MSNVTGSCTNLGEFIHLLCPKNYKDNDEVTNMNSFSNTELAGLYDIDMLKEKNKNQLTHIYEQSDKNSLNNYVSGVGLKEGCQLVSMYYQTNDNNMNSYMTSSWGQLGPDTKTPNKQKTYGFNNCSFVMKSPALRNTYKEINANTRPNPALLTTSHSTVTGRPQCPPITASPTAASPTTASPLYAHSRDLPPPSDTMSEGQRAAGLASLQKGFQFG